MGTRPPQDTHLHYAQPSSPVLGFEKDPCSWSGGWPHLVMSGPSASHSCTSWLATLYLTRHDLSCEYGAREGR